MTAAGADPADAQEGGRRWRDRAACRTEAVDPEVFFPTAQAGPAYVRQVARAVAVCARCPVRSACLEFALQALPDGIAGGTTPEQRRTIARRRRASGRQHGRRRHAPRLEVDRVSEAGGGVGGVPGYVTRAEASAAGRTALQAGRPVRAVAQEFGVSERTAQRWAQQVRAQQVPAEQVRAG